jgi:hypothetical protein
MRGKRSFRRSDGDFFRMAFCRCHEAAPVSDMLRAGGGPDASSRSYNLSADGLNEFNQRAVWRAFLTQANVTIWGRKTFPACPGPWHCYNLAIGTCFGHGIAMSLGQSCPSWPSFREMLWA